MNGIGKAFGKFLSLKKQLPRNKLKQLIRDQHLVEAVIKGYGPLSSRKQYLNQKGGFLPAILPLVAKTLGPSLVAPLIGKILR